MNPKTGAALLRVSPVVPDPMASTTTTAAPSPCRRMMTCGEGVAVLVKVVPRPGAITAAGKNLAHVADNVVSEISAMQVLQRRHPLGHPNVITLLDVLEDQDYYYLVLPYLRYGDLFDYVLSRGKLALPEARSYFSQMMAGLLYMKQQGLSHHDVSLENVMRSNETTVQIIDLGMAIRVPGADSCSSGTSTRHGSSTKSPYYHHQLPGNHSSSSNKHHQSSSSSHPPQVHLISQPSSGKRSYVAPEVVLEEPFDPFAADMWSLGICLYLLLTGRPLYDSPKDLAFRMMAAGAVKDVIEAYEGYGLVLPVEAKGLVCMMLDSDPKKRPTLEELACHPFLHVESGNTSNQGKPSSSSSSSSSSSGSIYMGLS